MARIKPGDLVVMDGRTYEVAVIYYQDHYEREGWFVKFRDTLGKLHYWKQYIDGGKLIRRHRLINSCGMDCTDIFRKYGYNV